MDAKTLRMKTCLADVREALVSTLLGVDSLRHYSIKVEGRKDWPTPCIASIKGWQIAEKAVDGLVALNANERLLIGDDRKVVEGESPMERYASSIPRSRRTATGWIWYHVTKGTVETVSLFHEEALRAIAKAHGYILEERPGTLVATRLEDGRAHDEADAEKRSRTVWTVTSGVEDGVVEMSAERFRLNT